MSDSPTLNAFSRILEGRASNSDFKDAFRGAATLGASDFYREAGNQIKNELAPDDAPPPPEMPDLPDPNSPENLKKEDEAALEQRKRAGAGRASTILTGGTGLLGKPSLSRRVLLGN